MRKSTPIRVTVYAPQSPKREAALSSRIAQIHADAVARRVKELNCPTYQKIRLLDAVIHTIQERSQKETDRVR